MRRRYDPLMELPNLCIHHWLCGDQDQLVVHAVCKKCGARAEFRQEHCFGVTYYHPQPWNDPSMPWMQSAYRVGAIGITLVLNLRIDLDGSGGTSMAIGEWHQGLLPY